MAENKWFVIFNPVSGRNKFGKLWNGIHALLKQHSIEHEYVETERHGHAIELAIDAIRTGYRKILAIGGDGTLNEVANGILSQTIVDSKEITLGIIPAGTGNDWVRSLGVPKDIKKAVRLLLEGDTVMQDVGKIWYHEGMIKKERYFVNIAGLGYDAFIANTYLKGGKVAGGLSYILYTLRGLWSYESVPMRFEVPDRSYTQDTFLIAVCLGKYFGNGMQIAPNAVLDDGQFDLISVRGAGKWTIIKDLYRLYNGTILKHPLVSAEQQSAITIQAPKEQLAFLQVDGEGLGHTPVEIQLQAGRLKVICGKQ